MPRKVISFKYLPARLPIWPTVIMLLVLDRFGWPPAAAGAIGLWFALMWLACLYCVATEERVAPGEIRDRD